MFHDLGCRVDNFGFKVDVSGFRVQYFKKRFRIDGLGFVFQ